MSRTGEPLIYCLVRPDGIRNSYYYISNNYEINIGDTVLIPFGKENYERVGEVISVERYSLNTCPYPPEKTKQVIRIMVADPSQEYEFCEVRPITHKQKTFFYLNEIQGLKAGDYVDIPFGSYDEIRVAKVLSVGCFTSKNAPISVYSAKKTIRLLNEENSDYVRFIRRNGDQKINPKRYLAPKSSSDCGLKSNSLADIAHSLKVTENLDAISFERRLSIASFFDPNRVIWGADTHQYMLGSKVYLEEIRNFEKAYEVKLPSDYVKFLTEVGNGCLGIREIDFWDYHFSYNYLKYTFPLEGKGLDVCIPDFAEKEKTYCDNTECVNCEYRKTCIASYMPDDYEKLEFGYRRGLLYLRGLGCTYANHMLITGSNAGSIWRENEGESIFCVANSFTEFVENEVNEMIYMARDYLKLILKKASLDELVKHKYNGRNMYIYDPSYLLGLIGIKTNVKEGKDVMQKKELLRKKLEELYSAED